MRSFPAVRIGALVTALAVWLIAAPVVTTARQATPTPAERIAALKASLAQSQKQLRQYEWMETTVLSLKGEEKSRKQQRVYYGADGKLQKVAVGQPAAAAAEPARGGARGGRLKAKVVENKKDEMKDYMEQASALIQKYVPPSPEDIERAKAKAKVDAPAAGRVRVTFADYLLPGDHLAIDVDAAANKLQGLSVASYLDKQEDTVTLDVKFGALADGTSYTAESTLDVKAKNIRVVIQNSGHRPIVK